LSEELIINQPGAPISVPVTKPALKFGWQTYTKHFMFLIGAAYVASSIGHIIFLWVPEAVRGILTICYGAFFLGGLLSILLTYCDGGVPKFDLLFSKWKQFWKFLVGLVIFTVAVAVGLILFVIPGVFLMMRLEFYPIAIAERDYGPIEALKYSWEITQGCVWNLIRFHLAVAGIMIIPVILAGILIFLEAGVLAMSAKISFTLAASLISIALAPILALFGELAWIHCYRQMTMKQAGANLQGPIPAVS
jgi:hypothetical protein